MKVSVSVVEYGCRRCLKDRGGKQQNCTRESHHTQTHRTNSQGNRGLTEGADKSFEQDRGVMGMVDRRMKSVEGEQ